jgi:23S rRNA pseudouridine2605 synthase
MSSKDKIRLQRFLAQSGVASRRKCEDIILAGRISVNGRIVRELGTRVDARRDRVEFDRKRVMPEDHVWLVLNKPDATVSSTHDPEGRKTVIDVLPRQHTRLYPVGRLDYHTEGVLLLTNDGELANALLHPKQEIPRTYHVKIKGDIQISDLDKLREGVTIETGQTVNCHVALVRDTSKNTWIEMTIKQGINHQIHQMLACVDKMVLKLIRTDFAGITVDGLPTGKCRELGQREITDLRALVGLTSESRRSQVTTGSRRINREAGARQKKPAKRASTPARRPSPTTARASTRRRTSETGDGAKTNPRGRKGAPPRGTSTRSRTTEGSAEEKRTAFHEDGTPKRRTFKGARAEKRQANKEGRERNRAAREEAKTKERKAPKRGAAKSKSPKRGAAKSEPPKRGVAKSKSPKRGVGSKTETKRPVSKKKAAPKKRATDGPKPKARKAPPKKRGAASKAKTPSGKPGRPAAKRARKSPPKKKKN